MKQRTATKQLQVGLEVCWGSFVWVIPAPYMVNIFCDLVLVHLLQINNFLSYLLNFSCFCFLFQTCSEVIFLFYYFIFLPQNSVLFQELFTIFVFCFALLQSFLVHLFCSFHFSCQITVLCCSTHHCRYWTQVALCKKGSSINIFITIHVMLRGPGNEVTLFITLLYMTHSLLIIIPSFPFAKEAVFRTWEITGTEASNYCIAALHSSQKYTLLSSGWEHPFKMPSVCQYSISL